MASLSVEIRSTTISDHSIVLTAFPLHPGANKKTTDTGLLARKLDEETEEFHLPKVESEVKKKIQAARIEKKLTQAQLAQAINEQPRVVQEYESGKAVPNQQVLAKLERILGVKLRGKM